MISLKVETLISKTGLPVLQIEHEGRKLFIHSKYDPVKEAGQILSKYEKQIEQFQHVLFYGVGLGYHVKAFLEKYPEKLASTYEPIEEVGEVCAALQSKTGLKVSKLRHAFIERDEDELEKYLYTFSNHISQKVLIIVLPVYERFLKDEVIRFLGKFKQIVEEQKSNIGTNAFFSKRWTINSLMNLPSTFENPNFLLEHADTFRDKPVILAAAGPSLSEEIENLKQIKKHGLAYIFAVGSANKALIAHGIHPDAVFTYDPQGHNASVFKELMDSGNTTVPMVYGTSVGFETVQLYPGPKFHFVTAQDTITQNFHETALPIVNDAYSIAIVTLQILYQLQVKKVILVGQNFAFKNDLFYAQEIKRYDKELKQLSDARVQKRDTEETLFVPDVFGNKILTNKGFNNMRTLMEKYISENPQIPVVNTTRGGAAIAGTTFKPLVELLETDLTETIVNIDWGKQGEPLIKSEQTMKRLKQIQKDLDLYPKQNDALFKHFHTIEQSIDRLKEHQVQKQLEKTDQLMRKLTSNTIYALVIRSITRNLYNKLQSEVEVMRIAQPTKEKLVNVINLFAPYLNICRKVYKEIAPIIRQVALPIWLQSKSEKEYIATSGVFHYIGEWKKKAHAIQEKPEKAPVHYCTAIETKEKNAAIQFRFTGKQLTIYGTNHSEDSLKVRVTVDNQVYNYTIRDCIDEEQYGSFARQKLIQIKNLKQELHHVMLELTSENPHVVFEGIETDQTGRASHIYEVTSPSELEIGKRIRCHYKATYNTVGEFERLGEETKNFLPVEASANPNGDFYFIMVDGEHDQKTLIADRNIQNYICYPQIEDRMIKQINVGTIPNTRIRLLRKTGENNHSDEWIKYLQGTSTDENINKLSNELIWNYERNVDEGRGQHSFIDCDSIESGVYSKYYNSKKGIEYKHLFTDVTGLGVKVYLGFRPVLEIE